MSKKLCLYSLISLSAVGGFYVLSANIALAANFSTVQVPVTISGTVYTGFMANKGSPHPITFFTDSVSSDCQSGPDQNPIGTGRLCDSGSGNANVSGSFISNWECADNTFVDCTFVDSADKVINLDSGFFSTRDLGLSATGGTEYTAYTNFPPAIPDHPNNETRIISLTPEEGTTTSNPVTFALHAYISPDDVGDVLKISIEFRNIDQNVFLAGALSPSTINIFYGIATTTGDWYYATTTILGNGNYRVNVTLKSCASAFGVCVLNVGNPFYGVDIDESHQFVVGEETFIGHISQQSFREISSILASSTATSSAALAKTCNPLGGVFDISHCLSYMFIPDAANLIDSLNSFKDGFLIRMPWGYVTRFVSILSSPSTSTLPAISYTFDSGGPLAGETWDIDTDGMIASGGAFLDSVENVDSHRTIKDVFYPIIQLVVGLALVLQIVHDLTGSHHHVSGPDNKGRKA